MSLARKRVLLGLVTVVGASAAAPTVASASIAPSLMLTPSSASAGSNPTVELDATFSPTNGDSVTDFTVSYPPGLLLDETLDGGACLAAPAPASTTPDSACQIGTATITTTAPGTMSLTLYLVAPPQATDIAGVASYNGTTLVGTAEVTLGSTGLITTFTNLVGLGVSEVDASITDLRVPTSCPSPAANVTVTADSQQSTAPASATAPLAVTGCSGLPYAPNLAAAVAADPATGGAEVRTQVAQAAGEAASKSITITFPSGLTPNAAALLPCLFGTGCTIGSATATSPLIPGALSGTVILGGSVTAPTLTISFPSPINVALAGAVDLSNNSVTFSDVPDIPLSDLSLDITGTNGQRAFLTDCKAASVTGSFTAQGGQTHSMAAPITLTGSCPASTGSGTGTGAGTPPPTLGSKPKPKPPLSEPKASGSITGLASGHPKLRFQLTDPPGAGITGVTLGLPSGLKFARSAFVSHKKCTKKGAKKKCTTTVRVNGLRVAGSSIKTVTLKGGRLAVTLKKAAARVTITAAGPLVTETRSLETTVRTHKAGTLGFTFNVTTADHKTTSLTLKLTAR